MSENQSFEINEDDLNKISKETHGFIYGDGKPETTNIFDYLKQNNLLFVSGENKNSSSKDELKKNLDQEKMAKYKDIFDQILPFDYKDPDINAEMDFDGNTVDLKKLKVMDYNYQQIQTQLQNLSLKLVDIQLNGWNKEKYGSSEDVKNFFLNYYVLLEMKNQFDKYINDLSKTREEIENYDSDLINTFLGFNSDVIDKIINALSEDQLKELEIEKIKGQKLKWDDLSINQLRGVSDVLIKKSNQFFIYSPLDKINKECGIYFSFWKIGSVLNKRADLEENFLSSFDIENYSHMNNRDDICKIIGPEKAKILDCAAKIKNIIFSAEKSSQKVKSLCNSYGDIKPKELKKFLYQDLDNFANLTKQNDLVGCLKSRFFCVYSQVPTRISKIESIFDDASNSPIEKIIKLYDLYKDEVSYPHKLKDLLTQDIEDYIYLTGDTSEIYKFQVLENYFNDDFKKQFEGELNNFLKRKEQVEKILLNTSCNPFDKMMKLYNIYKPSKPDGESIKGQEDLIDQDTVKYEDIYGKLKKLLYRDLDNFVTLGNIVNSKFVGCDNFLRETNKIGDLKDIFVEERDKAQKFILSSVKYVKDFNKAFQNDEKELEFIFGKDIDCAYDNILYLKAAISVNSLRGSEVLELESENGIERLKLIINVYKDTFFENKENLSEEDKIIKNIFDELPEKIDLIKDEIKKDPGVVWPVINFVVYFLFTVCTLTRAAFASKDVRDNLFRPIKKTKCGMVLKKYNEVLKQIDKVIETKTKIKTKETKNKNHKDDTDRPL